MEGAKEGKFDVVVVDKIDRFYRHLSGLLNALDQLNNYKVTFVSVQERLDFTAPWGKLTLTMLGMLAEIYIDNLRQETRKGKLQPALANWSKVTTIEQKRLLRIAIEAIFVRETAIVAVQPTFAFLPVLRTLCEESSKSGPDGIRVRGA